MNYKDKICRKSESGHRPVGPASFI